MRGARLARVWPGNRSRAGPPQAPGSAPERQVSSGRSASARVRRAPAVRGPDGDAAARRCYGSPAPAAAGAGAGVSVAALQVRAENEESRSAPPAPVTPAAAAYSGRRGRREGREDGAGLGAGQGPGHAGAAAGEQVRRGAPPAGSCDDPARSVLILSLVPCTFASPRNGGFRGGPTRGRPRPGASSEGTGCLRPRTGCVRGRRVPSPSHRPCRYSRNSAAKPGDGVGGRDAAVRAGRPGRRCGSGGSGTPRRAGGGVGDLARDGAWPAPSPAARAAAAGAPPPRGRLVRPNEPGWGSRVVADGAASRSGNFGLHAGEDGSGRALQPAGAKGNRPVLAPPRGEQRCPWRSRVGLRSALPRPPRPASTPRPAGRGREVHPGPPRGAAG